MRRHGVRRVPINAAIRYGNALHFRQWWMSSYLVNACGGLGLSSIHPAAAARQRCEGSDENATTGTFDHSDRGRT